MFIRLILLAMLLAGDVFAQNGDKKDGSGEKQIERVPREKIPPSPVLTPEQALQSFKVQPGFHLEIVASEPLVHDPVAMTFDPNGRIWVVEMSGYMRDYEGTGERDPLGSIVVLEDTDGDGKMDKRTVFIDKLTMPRAISLVRDGVLIAEPPLLWSCRDTNGDLKSDEKKEVLHDYGDIKSPEHTANGLMWGLDNWIYSADWTTRLKSLPGGEWKREPTAFRGQWGISQDDFGRLVYNSNSDQYRMDRVPSQYLQRNPNYRTPVGLNIDPIGDQSTYPARVTPGVNRGYRKETLRADGTLAKFTAACAPTIYRGENFPKEFYGNAFVCEPSANLIKRNLLWEDGVWIKGKQAYTNAEFIASTDERFRPVNLNNGPDGCLYIVDMYKGVLQHKIFLTSYLRQQSEMRKLETPVGYGRIYRVVRDGTKPKHIVSLGKATPAELVSELSNPNGWVRDTAQRLLVEKGDTSVAPDLKKLATEGQNFLGRLHALWTLDGLNQLDDRTLFALFKDQNPKVRAAAVRVAEPLLKTEDAVTYVDRFAEMAAADGDHDVQLQLAFTLGEIVTPKAEAAMQAIALKGTASPYVRDALLTGFYRRELEFLEKILADKSWSEKKDGRDQFLSGLAQAIFTEGKSDRVNRLFQLATAASDWQRTGLLNGLLVAGPQAKGKNAPPAKRLRFASEPSGFAALKQKAGKIGEKIELLVTWPGQPGYVPPPVIRPLTAEEQKRFDTGHEIFTTVCAACHQLTGLGMEGLAPPLADSEWALGPDQRLARIVLHGVRGPISVKGKTYELEMPGLATSFNDEQVASVLTYIRREWEHGADPVKPETIAGVRGATAQRAEAWSEAELLKVGEASAKKKK